MCESLRVCARQCEDARFQDKMKKYPEIAFAVIFCAIMVERMHHLVSHDVTHAAKIVEIRIIFLEQRWLQYTY